MISKEACEYLVGLGQKEVVIEADNGGQYTPDKLYRITAPTASSLVTHTLTSIVDYIKENADQLENVMVHVVSPTKVDVLSVLNSDRDREVFISAEAVIPNNLRLNSFVDAESFNIMLQSGFINSPVEEKGDDGDVHLLDYKKMLLQVTGCIKEEAVRQVGDDGVSQSATIKTGVASVEPIIVPNPVMLAAYRTFQEVKQPITKFVFRMKDGPSAALFEADGGMWKNLAIEGIKKYLEDELKGIEDVNVHILA